jgi:signal transduction histidine kinase
LTALLRVFVERSPLFRRVILVTLGVILCLAAAIIAAMIGLDLNDDDFLLLIELLISSAVVSLAGGALYIWSSQQGGWRLLLNRQLGGYAITIIVVVINVAISAAALIDNGPDRSLILLLLGFSIGIAAVFSILMSLSISEEFRKLGESGTRLASGETGVRIPVPAEQELAEIATALNAMAGKVDTAVARQNLLEDSRRGLILAVSHDLRTPLAALRVLSQNMSEKEQLDTATIRRYCESMERETVSLGRLIDDLFEMSRLDSGQVPLVLEKAAIGGIVLETIEQLQTSAGRQGVVLRSRIDWGTPDATIDAAQIRRVLQNLTQRAIHTAPQSGSVVIEVFGQGNDVQVNVRATAEGKSVWADDVDFERAEEPNGQRDDLAGYGLSLAISRRIIEQHEGRIWLAPSRDGTNMVCFRVPRA